MGTWNEQQQCHKWREGIIIRYCKYTKSGMVPFDSNVWVI